MAISRPLVEHQPLTDFAWDHRRSAELLQHFVQLKKGASSKALDLFVFFIHSDAPTSTNCRLSTTSILL
jgi:hypothetical protein